MVFTILSYPGSLLHLCLNPRRNRHEMLTLNPKPNPKNPSAHYLRTLGPLWVPKTINKDYLDPWGNTIPTIDSRTPNPKPRSPQPETMSPKSYTFHLLISKPCKIANTFFFGGGEGGGGGVLRINMVKYTQNPTLIIKAPILPLRPLYCLVTPALNIVGPPEPIFQILPRGGLDGYERVLCFCTAQGLGFSV